MTRQEALDGTIIQCLLFRYTRLGILPKGANTQTSLSYKSMRRQDSVRSDTHSIFFFTFPQKSLFVSLSFYIFATDKDDSTDETNIFTQRL